MTAWQPPGCGFKIATKIQKRSLSSKASFPGAHRCSKAWICLGLPFEADVQKLARCRCFLISWDRYKEFLREQKDLRVAPHRPTYARGRRHLLQSPALLSLNWRTSLHQTLKILGLNWSRGPPRCRPWTLRCRLFIYCCWDWIWRWLGLWNNSPQGGSLRISFDFIFWKRVLNTRFKSLQFVFQIRVGFKLEMDGLPVFFSRVDSSTALLGSLHHPQFWRLNLLG